MASGGASGGWLAFWDGDTPIYVSPRHKALHDARVARDVAALVPHAGAIVLDHGCGDATEAGCVAARCGALLLLDGAPGVRERLKARYAGHPKVEVLAPEHLPALPDGSLDLVVANSLVQYLPRPELARLVALWRDKLREGGRLVLGDVIPPNLGALADARALLAFAWEGGFVRDALLGLARTALSDYRRLRRDLGLTTLGEGEVLAMLENGGFAAERLAKNLGHNPRRMTFRGVKRSDEAQAAAEFKQAMAEARADKEA